MNRLSNKFIVVKARLQILFYILENQTIEQRFKIEFAVTLKRLENSNTRSKAVKIVLVKETQARFRLLIANLVVDMTKFAACFLMLEISLIPSVLAFHVYIRGHILLAIPSSVSSNPSISNISKENLSSQSF